jgi:hypothetical protein
MRQQRQNENFHAFVRATVEYRESIFACICSENASIRWKWIASPAPSPSIVVSKSLFLSDIEPTSDFARYALDQLKQCRTWRDRVIGHDDARFATFGKVHDISLVVNEKSPGQKAGARRGSTVPS